MNKEQQWIKWFNENCKPSALDSGLFLYEGGFWPKSFLKDFWEENIYIKKSK